MPARPTLPPALLAHLKAFAAAHGLERPAPGAIEHGTSGDDALTVTPPARLVLGLAGDDTLTGAAGDDNLAGGRGGDSLTGAAGGDRLFGDLGNDTQAGGAGVDTLVGGPGSDLLVGGPGADVFAVGGPHPDGAPGLDRIVDFTHGEDRIVFGRDDVATAANFATGSAADFASALALANGKIAGGAADFVAVKVGADVIVFADSHHDDGTADAAVVLVGRSLADIGFGDIH